MTTPHVVTQMEAKAAVDTLLAFVYIHPDTAAPPVVKPPAPPTPAPPISAPQSTIFAPTAFCYQDISKAPAAADSAALTADAVRQMHQYYGQPTRTNVQINTLAYAAPVYIAGPNDPIVNVGYNNTDNTSFDDGLRAQFTGVPMPVNAMPADGSDQEMVVYSPSQDKLWEFWRMKFINGQWVARWGGRLDNVSKSNGIFPGTYGTTATSLPFLAGQISLAEMAAAAAGKANAIPHAIGIAFVDTKPGHCWPAQRDDGWNPPPPAPVPIQMEGRRLRIDPTVNVAALKLNPIAAAVTLAAQKYGFVVWDKAGSVGIRAENPKSLMVTGKPNPYPGWFAGIADYDLLDNVPWASLQAIPAGYGQ
jgi:hypothetical protein